MRFLELVPGDYQKCDCTTVTASLCKMLHSQRTGTEQEHLSAFVIFGVQWTSQGLTRLCGSSVSVNDAIMLSDKCFAHTQIMIAGVSLQHCSPLVANSTLDIKTKSQMTVKAKPTGHAAV